jgi:hypothetical protein
MSTARAMTGDKATRPRSCAARPTPWWLAHDFTTPASRALRFRYGSHVVGRALGAPPLTPARWAPGTGAN